MHRTITRRLSCLYFTAVFFNSRIDLVDLHTGLSIDSMDDKSYKVDVNDCILPSGWKGKVTMTYFPKHSLSSLCVVSALGQLLKGS